MEKRLFECQCGQIARSLFEYNRHPRSADCGVGVRVPVKAVLEERPEVKERDPAVTKYPRIDPGEVFK